MGLSDQTSSRGTLTTHQLVPSEPVEIVANDGIGNTLPTAVATRVAVGARPVWPTQSSAQRRRGRRSDRQRRWPPGPKCAGRAGRSRMCCCLTPIRVTPACWPLRTTSGDGVDAQRVIAMVVKRGVRVFREMIEAAPRRADAHSWRSSIARESRPGSLRARYPPRARGPHTGQPGEDEAGSGSPPDSRDCASGKPLRGAGPRLDAQNPGSAFEGSIVNTGPLGGNGSRRPCGTRNACSPGNRSVGSQ